MTLTVPELLNLRCCRLLLSVVCAIQILFFAGETSAKRNFLLECIVVSVVDQFESDVESSVSGCSGLI